MTYDPSSRAATPRADSQALLSPLAWLKEQLAKTDAATADQVASAAGLAGEVSPGLAPAVGGSDPAWDIAGASDQEVEQALQAGSQVCHNHCPIHHRCVEDQCRYWRLEKLLEQRQSEGVTP